MPHFPFKFFDLGFTKVISFTFTEKLLSTFLRQSKIGRGTKRTDFLLPGCCTRIWKSLLFWLFCTYPEYILCILQYAVKHGNKTVYAFQWSSQWANIYKVWNWKLFKCLYSFWVFVQYVAWCENNVQSYQLIPIDNKNIRNIFKIFLKYLATH